MSHFCPLLPFDALVAFHKTDPQGFEKYRSVQLNLAVVTAPIEYRAGLTKVLDHIDATRKSAKSAQEAAAKAHALMSTSLASLAEGLHDLHSSSAELQTILILNDLKKISHFRPN
ncbi:hypothetical protein DIC66_21605 [Rhodoferax lacus]|uniref:Uncharacterized protein n=1 Tax=Rhodoferax lacus TaxID=2184758 RepID=A0A3E1R6K4_9BURK|nr:DUF3135 domain-containing protein [Rhodoferax lacus]RFO94811.1 hypothetical protein DIC66_21605 [Rhodoferax lacus]